ncbi:MAG: YeeE/YedE family protein [Granulosicoccaceae bacterium]
METSFTPGLSLIGGLLIGTAAVLYLWGCGRIMGISGILSRLLPPSDGGADKAVRIAFLLGMLALPLAGILLGQLQQMQPATSNVMLLIMAGLAAGYGTVRGSGCTSGHGVCGISRLSPRSLIATGIFMVSAGVCVYVARHLMGWF